MTTEIVEEDSVKRIEDLGEDQPVRVLFRFHAAFYILPRDTPQFASWLDLLNQSKRQDTLLRFTYNYRDQSFTSLERVP